jgi:2-isopropylmalate synthase
VHVEERVGDDEPPLAEATVKVRTKGTRHIESAEGQGPVGALDNALRKALTNDYPELDSMELEDFRVRVLDESVGTGAVVRVLIDMSDGEQDVDHGRRLGEHHRSVLGGADGRIPLRSASSPVAAG